MVTDAFNGPQEKKKKKTKSRGETAFSVAAPKRGNNRISLFSVLYFIFIFCNIIVIFYFKHVLPCHVVWAVRGVRLEWAPH